MDVRLAPMEGLTDAVYRQVHNRCYGGIGRYYIPFVSPTQHHVFTPKELRALLPENNQGLHAVPQVMTHSAADFIWVAERLKDMGYGEANLNLGCPSGTVTAKSKGSGLLRRLDLLAPLLDEICAHSPLPVSVKTRIGFESPDEWPPLLELLRQYPLHEIVIHPRTRIQFYKGIPWTECFDQAAAHDLPLVYNGDLFDLDSCGALQQKHPGMPMMLGRGLIANPALGRQLHGGDGLSVTELRAFLDQLQEEYRRLYPEQQAHSRMREVMKYVSCCFDGAEKARKALRKSTPANYAEAVARLLDCPLRETPGYDPEAWLH